MAKRKQRFIEWSDADLWQDPWDMLDEIELERGFLSDYRWPYASLPYREAPCYRFADRVYAVNESFWAGPFPGDLDRQKQAENLTWLLDQGVTRMISLMERGERDWKGRRIGPYENEIKTLGLKRGITVACDRFPVRDMTTPTINRTVKVLNRIDHAMERGEKVYVHCLGGYGRTGVIVGCWLARHGYGKGKEALDYLDYLRRNEVTQCASPQTYPQINRVKGWKLGK